MLTLLFPLYLPNTEYQFARFLVLLALETAFLLGLVWIPQQCDKRDGGFLTQIWRAAGRNRWMSVGVTLLLFLCGCCAALVGGWLASSMIGAAKVAEGIMLFVAICFMISCADQRQPDAAPRASRSPRPSSAADDLHRARGRVALIPDDQRN